MNYRIRRLKLSKVSLTVATLLVAGCSYGIVPEFSPAGDIHSEYSDKVLGDWALHVDAREMRGVYGVTGVTCLAHKYPVDAQAAFETSVVETLAEVFEHVELTDSPIGRGELRMNRWEGLIMVKAHPLKIQLTATGLFFMNMHAKSGLMVSVAVDGSEERFFGTTVEGDKSATAKAGLACEGGADAIKMAVEDSMKEVLKRMAERISNAPSLRVKGRLPSGKTAKFGGGGARYGCVPPSMGIQRSPEHAELDLEYGDCCRQARPGAIACAAPRLESRQPAPANAAMTELAKLAERMERRTRRAHADPPEELTRQSMHLPDETGESLMQAARTWPAGLSAETRSFRNRSRLLSD